MPATTTEVTAKLDEFRENNRHLNAQKAELEAKLRAYEGIDPDEHKALKARMQAFEGITPDDIVVLQTKAAQLESELATLRGESSSRAEELTAERKAHAATQLRNAVGLEFLRNGGRPEALPFMVDAASKVFDVTKNGDVTSKAFSPTNPGESLTIAEWMRQQLVDSGYLFAPSRGGGAHHGTAPASSAARTVDRNDVLAFGKNIEGIAAGKVSVV